MIRRRRLPAEQSGYPLMRLVVLMALRSYLLAAAAFGPYAVDERAHAASLWDTVPDHSLVLIDRHHLPIVARCHCSTTSRRAATKPDSTPNTHPGCAVAKS